MVAVLAVALPLDSELVTILPRAGASLSVFADKTGLLSGKQHHFVFDRYRVDVDWHAEKPATSGGAVVIQSASIRCQDTWANEGTRRKIQKVVEELLLVSKYPEIRFAATHVRPLDEPAIASAQPRRYAVDGKLLLRGVEKPLTLFVNHSDSTVAGEARIRMTDFGMKPPSTALGLIGTKDEMLFQFKLTL